MTKNFYVYQSPRREKRRSAPVAEDDYKTRKMLEESGWIIVETYEGTDANPPVAKKPETKRAQLPGAELLDITGMNERVAKALGDAGYITIGDLAVASDDDLLAVPYVGEAVLRHIRLFLEPDDQPVDLESE